MLHKFPTKWYAHRMQDPLRKASRSSSIHVQCFQTVHDVDARKSMHYKLPCSFNRPWYVSVSTRSSMINSWWTTF